MPKSSFILSLLRSNAFCGQLEVCVYYLVSGVIYLPRSRLNIKNLKLFQKIFGG